MSSLFLLIYLLIAAALQLACGSFPTTFMAFPLNVIFALLWLATLFLFYRQERHGALMRYLLSGRATFVSILLFIAGCLVIGLLPALSAQTSWPFLFTLLLMQSHLAVVCFRGWKQRGRIRWRFLLNHAGLWLALFAGFWGAPDCETFRLPVRPDTPTREAFLPSGAAVFLDYEAQLLDFRIDYFDNGMPSHYEAHVRIGSDSVTLTVNHPYARTWYEDIYLAGYDTTHGRRPEYCILQVVREPWKGVTVLGIGMMLAGAALLFIQGLKKKEA